MFVSLDFIGISNLWIVLNDIFVDWRYVFGVIIYMIEWFFDKSLFIGDFDKVVKVCCILKVIIFIWLICIFWLMIVVL